MLDDLRRGDAGFAAADCAGHDGAGLVEAGQDLADAAVGHAQLTTDVAWSDAQLGQLNDADTDLAGQRPAVHKQPTQLVHLAKVVVVCGSRQKNTHISK